MRPPCARRAPERPGGAVGLGSRILDSATGRAVLAAGAAGYIRLVQSTTRWRRIGNEVPERFWRAGEPFIGCFWHGRLMMMAASWDRSVPLRMLISEHRDGRLIARTIRNFGYDSIVGSTRKKGASALRGVLRALERGECVGFTPDGPRGPRMRASMGVVAAARLSGAPIVPGTYATSRRIVLGSWDRMILPWPFARGVFMWGQPIHVPRDADAEAMEAYRREVEDRLNAITAEADALVGRRTVEPAPTDRCAPGAGAAAPRGR